MGVSADGYQDTYWFHKPVFDTVQQCQIYVTLNAGNIKMHMAGQYGPKPIEMVYCVRQDHLSEFGVPDSI